MQHSKNRLGQKEEPTPVDAIEEPINTEIVLVTPNDFPFLRTGKELSVC